MKKFFIILILLLKFVSCIEVNFSCPKEVNMSEDFECKIEIPDNKMSYDAKITIQGDKKNINKIWEGTTWQRADWYAKKLINGEKTFARIKIDKEFSGKATGEIKLRETNSQNIVYEDNFIIKILENKTNATITENILENQTETKQQAILPNKEIKLNSKDIKTKKSVSFLDNKALKWLILISIGLFALILYLRRQKIKNGRKYKEDTFAINN